MKKLLYTMMALTASYISACTNNQSNKINRIPEHDKVQGYEPLSNVDMAFITKAGHGNAAEISEGQLAASKGFGTNVKDMGLMMVKDHTQALEELKAIGKQLNVQVPETPNKQQQDSEHNLSQQSGPAFDQAYIKAQIKEHKKTINLFEDEIKNGSNALVKAYAEKFLPVIKHHLEMAEQIEDVIK
jgi:putative membrane protein